MQRASAAESWTSSLKTALLLLSVVVMLTSLVDLFINRLLFRAGPEVLSHMSFDAGPLAVLGRISLSLEQLVLFAALGIAVLLLLREARGTARVTGSLLIGAVACSALLYFPLSEELGWAVSTLLVLVAATLVLVMVFLRASSSRGLPTRQRLTLGVFLALLLLSFTFPFYYRLYLLAGAIGVVALPGGIQAYQAGIFSVMAATVGAFAYAMVAPSPGYSLGVRRFAKAAVLPTIVVAPIAFGLFESYLMTQIFTLVIAMSTDFALSHDLVQLLAALWWVLLTAALLLVLKGRSSPNKSLIQEGVGLILLMSTTFLFNYPYYIMLGLLGVLLFAYPLREREEGIAE
ncbi:MAG: hypothetical protein LYZ70_03450 [Nitrososphaerales archaeon]|nr:hypothetical protein [Nitrososphaerales archaeon]